MCPTNEILVGWERKINQETTALVCPLLYLSVYHLNLPLQEGLPESLKIFSVFPGINRQPLHLYWDDNSSSTVQLHYWPCQHLWHEASPHVQGSSHHRQQERDTWPAWVCTGVPLEQVTCQCQHVWNIKFDLFWKCFILLSFSSCFFESARVLTRIWKVYTTMMISTWLWWCATTLRHLRNSQTGRGICWGKTSIHLWDQIAVSVDSCHMLF